MHGDVCGCTLRWRVYALLTFFGADVFGIIGHVLDLWFFLGRLHEVLSSGLVSWSFFDGFEMKERVSLL